MRFKNYNNSDELIKHCRILKIDAIKKRTDEGSDDAVKDK